MRWLAYLLGLSTASAVVAQIAIKPTAKPEGKPAPTATSPPPTQTSAQSLVGQWRGTFSMGPSKIAQTMDGDQLYKLQMSKAFLKSMSYELDVLPDGTFKSTVVGPEIDRRRGKGNWQQVGNLVTLTLTQESGMKVTREMKAMLSSDGKKFVVQIPSKPGLPFSKLIFKKEVVPVTTSKPARRA